jgi:hypothetical protein
MPDVIGDLAVNTRVHLPLLLAHEAAGAPGTRHSPRPLFFGRTLMAKARAMCAARTRGCGFSSLRAQRSDPHLLCLAMDCFAGARNDGFGLLLFDNRIPDDELLWSGTRSQHTLGVVPADAGTHNPGRLLWRRSFGSLPKRGAAAYGSRRSPGRR